MTPIYKTLALLLLTGAASILSAQNTGLTINVSPEAHLNVTSLPISFTVATPGEVAVSQPVTVSAWVRNLPGQQIQLMAQLDGLTGPSKDVQVSNVSWSGNMDRATGGATVSHCTAGSFAAGSAQSLIAGWNASGIASCSVTFTVKTDASWAPGSYTGHADLKLLVQ